MTDTVEKGPVQASSSEAPSSAASRISRRLRISLPVDVWDPERGGAERYLDRLVRELGKRGHETTVLCLRQRASWGPVPGVRIERLRVPPVPRWLRELGFARAALRAHRSARRDVLLAIRHALFADVYQPHGGSYRASRDAHEMARPPLQRLLSRLTRPFRPSLRVLWWLDRQVIVGSPGLITVSVSSKVEEDLRRFFPGCRFDFERLLNPVDVDAFHDRDRLVCRAALEETYGLADDEPLAVFIGHNFHLKGLDAALDALRSLERWHLIVVGRGRKARYLRRLRREGWAGRVHFAGHSADPRTLLAGADALLQPTWYDTCSLVTLEAVACGTPVVTTSRNGSAEIVRSAGAGVVVDDPRDVDGLRRGLLEIVARPEAYRAQTSAFREQLSWERHLERFEEILQRAAARSGARR